MIEHRVGDIFDQPDINVIVHQANLYHTFGAGIAKIIRERYPYAYAADCATDKGLITKLGLFSVGKPSAGQQGPIFVNLYSQTGIGGQDRNTSYDAMTTGLQKLHERLRDKKGFVLGIPYTIGCGLAGGSWLVVSAIIKSIFAESSLEVVICRLPSQPEEDSCFDLTLKDAGFIDPNPNDDEVF